MFHFHFDLPMPVAFVPVHFGTACLTFNFGQERRPFRLTQFLPAEAGDQLRIFADATPAGNGLNTFNRADEFHRRSLVQRSSPWRTRYNAFANRPIPLQFFANPQSRTKAANVDTSGSRA